MNNWRTNRRFDIWLPQAIVSIRDPSIFDPAGDFAAISSGFSAISCELRLESLDIRYDIVYPRFSRLAAIAIHVTVMHASFSRGFMHRVTPPGSLIIRRTIVP